MIKKNGVYSILCGTLVYLFSSSTSWAWETSCKVDSFTDEKSCRIEYMHRDNFILIQGKPDEQNIAFSFSAIDEILDTNDFILRVDDNPAIDLIKMSRVFDLDTALMSYMEERDLRQLVEQLKSGSVLRVRVSRYRDASIIESFSLSGFTEAWQQFASEINLDWQI